MLNAVLTSVQDDCVAFVAVNTFQSVATLHSSRARGYQVLKQRLAFQILAKDN